MRLHPTKNFCTAMGTINKMKRPSTEWEKIFANNISDKGSISKIYKKLIQLNTKKQSNWKTGRRAEQTFFQRKHIDGQQTYEKTLSITHHQVKANQNHDEVSPHTCWNGYHQKDNK